MILCLDAGNSRLKWGLLDSSQGMWRAKGVVGYGTPDAPDALEHLQDSLPATPQRVVACNVAGPEITTRIERLAQTLQLKLDWLHSSASAGGVENGYESPKQLGADRWAALIGARQQHAGALIVVMAGTATTIDSLDAAGRFQGGLILPGLFLMRAALASNTAGLPQASGRFRPHPTNTDDAIVSGALQATLGAIERQTALTPGAFCLLSGGAAGELAPLLTVPYRSIDNLVLEGLARVALGFNG